MEVLDFWIGMLVTLLDASNPCSSTVSFLIRFILSFPIRYLVRRVVTFKISRRTRINAGRPSLATVLTIIVLGQFCLELVFWVR